MANRGIGLNFVPAEEGDTLGAMKTIVRKGTKAYEKGLRTGDYLISVDDTPIPDMCTYMLLVRNGTTKRFVFRSPEGKIKEVDW